MGLQLWQFTLLFSSQNPKDGQSQFGIEFLGVVDTEHESHDVAVPVQLIHLYEQAKHSFEAAR